MPKRTAFPRLAELEKFRNMHLACSRMWCMCAFLFVYLLPLGCCLFCCHSFCFCCFCDLPAMALIEFTAGAKVTAVDLSVPWLANLACSATLYNSLPDGPRTNLLHVPVRIWWRWGRDLNVPVGILQLGFHAVTKILRDCK